MAWGQCICFPILSSVDTCNDPIADSIQWDCCSARPSSTSYCTWVAQSPLLSSNQWSWWQWWQQCSISSYTNSGFQSFATLERVFTRSLASQGMLLLSTSVDIIIHTILVGLGILIWWLSIYQQWRLPNNNGEAHRLYEVHHQGFNCICGHAGESIVSSGQTCTKWYQQVGILMSIVGVKWGHLLWVLTKEIFCKICKYSTNTIGV